MRACTQQSVTEGGQRRRQLRNAGRALPLEARVCWCAGARWCRRPRERRPRGRRRRRRALLQGRQGCILGGEQLLVRGLLLLQACPVLGSFAQQGAQLALQLGHQLLFLRKGKGRRRLAGWGARGCGGGGLLAGFDGCSCKGRRRLQQARWAQWTQPGGPMPTVPSLPPPGPALAGAPWPASEPPPPLPAPQTAPACTTPGAPAASAARPRAPSRRRPADCCGCWRCRCWAGRGRRRGRRGAGPWRSRRRIRWRQRWQLR